MDVVVCCWMMLDVVVPLLDVVRCCSATVGCCWVLLDVVVL